MSERARLWCGTGYQVREWSRWMEELVTSGKVRWVIGQLEVCPDTQREHLQYALYFNDKQSLKQLKGKTHPADHFEIARGDVGDQLRYCTKEESRKEGPWEFGSRPQPGQRTDLDQVSREVQSYGIRHMRQLAEQAPSMVVRYGSGFGRLMAARPSVARRHVTKCYWLWGPSNIGKTTGWIRAGVSYDEYFAPAWEEISRTWNMEGYSEQGVVLFDEAGVNPVPFRTMLQLGNEGPVKMATKGGSPISFDSAFVVCTSNTPPPASYSDTDQWSRRWEVIEVTSYADTSEFWRQVARRLGGSITPQPLGTTSGQPAGVTRVSDFFTPVTSDT